MSLRDTLLQPEKERRTSPALLTLLSLLLPALVFAAALAALGITPFGSHNLAISDARYYLNSELFFGRLVRGQENWLYSLNNGLGGNEWSHLAWGGINIGGRCADNLNACLLQGTRQVQRSLAAQLHDDTIALFALVDIKNILKGERLEVEVVGGIVVRGNGLGVGVDHDGLEASSL